MVTRHKSSILSVVKKFDLFGPPELLEGEDPTEFAALHDQVWAAIAPVNIIEEIFAHDFLLSEWENRRWRRHMSHQMNARTHKALQDVLRKHLDYGAYEQEFAQTRENFLKEHLPADEAKVLARQCAMSEPKAEEKFIELLTTLGLDLDDMLDCALHEKAEEIALAYARREPKAVKQVQEVLTSIGMTIDKLIAIELTTGDSNGNNCLAAIERLNGLTMDAVTRRNTSLRELDRRRTLLGQAMLVTVQGSDDGGYRAIEATSAKKGHT